MTATYQYDVFGPARSHGGSATEWSFTGEQNDPTGLEYLRARYYDPTLGRFLSRDPFGGFAMSPQSLNRYAYALNNPINLTDPAGLNPAAGALVLVFVPGVGEVVVVVAATGILVCTLNSGCRDMVADHAGDFGEFVGSGMEKVGDLLGDLPGPFHEETRQASEPPPTFNGRGPGGGGNWSPLGDFGKIPGWAKAVGLTAAILYAADKVGIDGWIASLLSNSDDDNKE